MHRKDNNPRPPSALEDEGPSGGRVDVSAHDKVTSEYPPDTDPSVEISMGSVPEDDVDEPPTPLLRRETPRVPPPPPVSLTDPRIGETLVGRYRLDKLIGKGGMGRVYRATQFPLNRPVGVKILNPEFQRKDPQFVRRFFLEAASAARLTHPNTITVFDYGEAESGELFIAMEYLAGRPLSRVIASEGPFDPERALHVGMQICRALREAHTKGIIHRDLKPGNIVLLEEGDDADYVKVLDFGLVKLFAADDKLSSLAEPLTPDGSEGELTKAGMFLGSPKYMSPEQIQGVPLDPRTDIYSLGVLLYQMVVGKPPFVGASSVEVIYKHVNDPVPKPASFGVTVPLELEELIMGALAKKRDERYESMSAFLARMKDVRRLLTGISASVETGVDISLSELRARQHTPSIVVGAAAPTKPMAAATVSTRPQTRPNMPVPTEVAFVDASVAGATDETGSHLLLGQEPKPSRMSKLAPAIAASALVLVVGMLAFVVLNTNNKGREGQPPIAAIEDDPLPALGPPARVRFVSEPAGAEVFEHGVSLGRTPLVLTFRQDAEGTARHQFLFKIDGKGEVTRSVRIDRKEVEVSVRLDGTRTPPPPTGGTGDEDYKENPY